MSATQEIFQLLAQDIAINKCLSNGLINNRALAKFLIDKYHLSYTEEAVVSAIRRYESTSERDKVVEDVLDNATVFAKNNVACLTTDIPEQEKIAKILEDAALNRNVRVARAKKFTKLMVYDKELTQLQSHFLDSQIVRVQKNLAEIRLLLNKDAYDAIGLLSKIAAQIALYDIAIQEIIIAMPEFLIYVHDADGLKTQEALLHLIEKKN